MNIYVGNLPLTAGDNDLLNIFSKFGEIYSAKVIIDREKGKSSGFGFVEMHENSAKKAITELNGAVIEDRHIIVHRAIDRMTSPGEVNSPYRLYRSAF